MSRRRILNVGLGGRGRGWLRHLLSRPDLQTVGWVDPSEASLEAAREVAPEVRVPVFSSVREATEKVEADIAVIAAASTVRLENCLEAIDAGLHILVGKPFALSLADARTIVLSTPPTGGVGRSWWAKTTVTFQVSLRWRSRSGQVDWASWESDAFFAPAVDSDRVPTSNISAITIFGR